MVTKSFHVDLVAKRCRWCWDWKPGIRRGDNSWNHWKYRDCSRFRFNLLAYFNRFVLICQSSFNMSFFM